MYEFMIRNILTREIRFVCGYDIYNAFSRNPHLDMKEWDVENSIYID